MLLTCPECELPVSDKAITCPHCGYPLSPKAERKRSKTKHMRLPNGFGQISEIKNRNLRKPFRAMITIGKDNFGKPICKPLRPYAYFETYNDAYEALVEYHKNPYEIESSITVKELYERWSPEYFKGLKEGSIRPIKSAWAYCSSLYDVQVNELRGVHIKKCIENGEAVFYNQKRKASPAIQRFMKLIFNQMLDYALSYNLVQRNVARGIKLDRDITSQYQTATKPHVPFTDEEVKKLWKNVDKLKYVDLILIQCYSGWRPKELEMLLVENVDLEKGYFIGGVKTDAGIDRVVPIHSRIYPYVKARYEEALALQSKYLFNYTEGRKNDTRFTYYRFEHEFDLIMQALGLNPEHRPHDGRKHFITQAKKYKVDEYAIKYLVGHKIADVTERVYTQREMSWLSTEIEKIK